MKSKRGVVRTGGLVGNAHGGVSPSSETPGKPRKGSPKWRRQLAKENEALFIKQANRRKNVTGLSQDTGAEDTSPHG